MKTKKFFKKTFFFLLALFLPLEVLAANLGDAFKVHDGSNNDPLDAVASQAGYNTKTTSIDPLIASVIQSLLSLLGVIFLVLMVYGGYLWMTAAGNEEKVTKAKNLMTAAIIGLIIVVGSYAISVFVVGKMQEAALNGNAFK